MDRNDITGQIFGSLKVVGIACRDQKNQKKWECVCACGNTHIAYSYNLKSGHTSKCLECSFAERGLRHRTHGKSKSRLYKTYYGMLRRCDLPTDKRFVNYGGKGVTVCEEWRKDFMAFYKWSIENGYKKDLTIDRIDVNGNYEPNNCRWANAKQQANNATRNHHITYNGKTQTIAEWAEELGLKYNTLRMRLTKYEMPPEKALCSKLYANGGKNGK